METQDTSISQEPDLSFLPPAILWSIVVWAGTYEMGEQIAQWNPVGFATAGTALSVWALGAAYKYLNPNQITALGIVLTVAGSVGYILGIHDQNITLASYSLGACVAGYLCDFLDGKKAVQLQRQWLWKNKQWAAFDPDADKIKDLTTISSLFAAGAVPWELIGLTVAEALAMIPWDIVTTLRRERNYPRIFKNIVEWGDMTDPDYDPSNKKNNAKWTGKWKTATRIAGITSLGVFGILNMDKNIAPALTEVLQYAHHPAFIVSNILAYIGLYQARKVKKTAA
jgi:phosphatidylglycerophosphate synthase